MTVVKPDDNLTYSVHATSVFLAGSIEMGMAANWQDEFISKFEGHIRLVLFNPRRDHWDRSWEQRQYAPKFNHQVNWELDKLEESNIIFMYFDPDTKSPISLLELGLYADSGKMIVVCPDDFYRKGNVEIVCTRYGVPIYNTLDEGIGVLMTRLKQI